MSKGLGSNYRLWVESATPGTFNMIKGNIQLKIARQGGTQDTSTKDDGAYGTATPTSKQVTITFSGIADLPDANGYTRFETLVNANPPAAFNIEIRKGGATGASGDKTFACSMYCSGFDTDMDKDDAAKYAGTLVSAAAPTTDTLAI